MRDHVELADHSSREASARPFLKDAWALYGLKRRDALRALLAAPAAVQVVAQLDEQLELSRLLTQILLHWREFFRAIWTDLLALVAPWVRIDLTHVEKDALTLSLLCVLAIVGSLFLPERESLKQLAIRSRQHRDDVQLLIIPLLATCTIGILIAFVGISDVMADLIARGLQWKLDEPEAMMLYIIPAGVFISATMLWIDPALDQEPYHRHPLLFFLPGKVQAYLATRGMLFGAMTMFLFFGFGLSPQSNSQESVGTAVAITMICATLLMIAVLTSWRALPIAIANAGVILFVDWLYGAILPILNYANGVLDTVP